MKRESILKIEYVAKTRLNIIYESGVFSTIIPLTIIQLKKSLKKNPNQVCIEDINKLKKEFVFTEKLSYNDQIETWTTNFGIIIKRTNEIITAQVGEEIIEIKESDIPKDKFRFSKFDFYKIKNKNKGKNDSILLLLKGREKSKI